jgi:serine/threonine protein kinase
MLGDKKVRVRFSDFGNSHSVSDPNSPSKNFTRGWTAPERVVMNGFKETLVSLKATDVFSLGAVFYFVLTNGKHAFGEDKYNQQIKIQKNECEIDNSLSVLQIHLIKSMINHDSNLRPTIHHIMRHPNWWEIQRKIGFLTRVKNRVEKGIKDKKLKFSEASRDSQIEDSYICGSNNTKFENLLLCTYIEMQPYKTKGDLQTYYHNSDEFMFIC